MFFFCVTMTKSVFVLAIRVFFSCDAAGVARRRKRRGEGVVLPGIMHCRSGGASGGGGCLLAWPLSSRPFTLSSLHCRGEAYPGFADQQRGGGCNHIMHGRSGGGGGRGVHRGRLFAKTDGDGQVFLSVLALNRYVYFVIPAGSNCVGGMFVRVCAA